MGDVKKVAATFLLSEYGMMGFAIGLGGNLLSQTTSSSEGFRFLGITLLVTGVLILILACVGCATLDCAPEAALTKSILCYLPLFFTLFGLAVFTLAVSSEGGGKSLPERAYKEYELRSYSNWMRNKVNDTLNWDNYYKRVLVKSGVCNKFTRDYELDTLDEFHSRDLSPLESGCCKPPDECNFEYKSPSMWIKPANQSHYSNKDCYAWENDQNTLCFNCLSCKGSFVQDLTSHWFWTGITLVILVGKHLILCVCIFCMICREGSSASYTRLV